MARREAIERHLFDRAAARFDLRPAVTLYAPPNPSFAGEAHCQPKARRGHATDKRTDRRLLTLALVLDVSGFVRRSRIFAGERASTARSPKCSTRSTPPATPWG